MPESAGKRLAFNSYSKNPRNSGMTNVSSFIKGTNQIYIQGSPEPVVQHQESSIKNNKLVPMAIDMYDETLKEFNRHYR
jgi:hypothetical protein